MKKKTKNYSHLIGNAKQFKSPYSHILGIIRQPAHKKSAWLMVTTSPIRIKDKELLKNSSNWSWLDCPELLWDDDDVISELLIFSILSWKFKRRDRCSLLSSIEEGSTANATILVDSASLLLSMPHFVFVQIFTIAIIWNLLIKYFIFLSHNLICDMKFCPENLLYWQPASTLKEKPLNKWLIFPVW